MLKVWLIDALRNIKVRIVSWLSIVTIVFIGTTLILGLYFGSSTVKKASSSFILQQNFKDFDISCNMGIKEDEIAKIKSFDGVNEVEGQISFPGELSLDNKSTGVTVLSTTEKISTPTVIEGTLPSSESECIVSYSALNKIGAKIGDEIIVNIASARFDGIISNKKYKITGIASHPDYMVNISTDYIVLPLSCFNTSTLSFDYSNVLIDADITEDTFSTSYKKRSTQIKSLLEDHIFSMSDERILTLNEELNNEYDNAKETINEELSKAKSELDKNINTFKSGIDTARITLENGEEELNTIKATAEKELAEAAAKIQSGEEEYNTMLTDGKSQLEQAEKDMEKELNDAKFQLFDAFLTLDASEKYLKEKEAEYAEGLEKLAEGKEKLNEGYAKYNETTSMLDSIINDSVIEETISILESIEGTEETIEILRDAEGKNTIERYQQLFVAYDNAPESFHDAFSNIGDIDYAIQQFSNLVNIKEELEEGQKKYDDSLEMLNEARQMLDQGWYDLQKGQEKLEEGKAELAKREPEARKQLEDAKNEFEEKKAEGAAKLEEARNTLSSKKIDADETIKTLEDKLLLAKDEYADQKEKGEKAIIEATLEYNNAKKEADNKLAEYMQQIETAKTTPCTYVVQSRDVNFPYVQTKSYMKAINGFFAAFTPLYASIIAIVCFFTMTIIIEEQTSQIGTCKAFGMHESEIMRKYIIFGVSAALLGAGTGIAGGFAIEKLLIHTMRNNLAFPLSGTGHNIPMIILLPSIEVLVTAIAVFWSCHKYIHCSAVGLINGNEPVKKYAKKAGKSFTNGVYFKLIIRNLFTDIGREIVSIVTIVICVFVVGFGIDIKLAYEGALSRQMFDIWHYDLSVTESGTITDEEKEYLKEAISEYETLYLPVSAGVITKDNSQILTTIICVDNMENFEKFYTLKDEYGKNISLTDDGVLITKEMEEKNGLSKNDTLHLISGNLKDSEVNVQEAFMLYAGKTIIMTRDYYEKVFGQAPDPNTYYIKTIDQSPKELKAKLSEIPGVSTVDLTKDLRDGNMAVVSLYNTVVAIVIIFSVLLTFMILLNLSNILVAHRMRELLTMRVNGFYNSQVIGYLVREILLTNILSMVIALAFGIPLTGSIIKSLETDAFMFVRSPFAFAWAASVVINALFSIVINYIAFKKVNLVPLTSINKY